LVQLKKEGHKIDVFGIGTNLVTCQAQPALGMVYKVVEFQGTARMKFSEEVGKVTLPGAKSVVRIYDADKTAPIFDLICLESELTSILKNDSELVYFTQKSLNSE
jgi:nicotinate phosphoribosyltransferase